MRLGLADGPRLMPVTAREQAALSALARGGLVRRKGAWRPAFGADEPAVAPATAASLRRKRLAAIHTDGILRITDQGRAAWQAPQKGRLIG